MKPIVNVDVKMPKKMLESLTLLETFCVANNIKEVDSVFVTNFLQSLNLSEKFISEYLY
jgi:hypothetical protein